MLASAENRDCTNYENRCQGVETAPVRGREAFVSTSENVRKIIGGIIPDNDCNIPASFAEFVVTKLQNESNGSVIANKAATSFLSYLHRNHTADTPDSDERSIRNWLALLIAKGTSPFTVRRYLGSIHSLYAVYARKSTAAESLFKTLREEISDDALWATFPHKDAVTVISRLAPRIKSQTDVNAESARLLFYILLLGGKGFATAITATVEGQLADIPQIKAVITRQKQSHRSKYLFGLNQSRQRPGQISRNISKRITSLLADAGYRSAEPITDDTICGWWIEAAIEAGIEIETIVSIIPHIPATHAWLKIAKPHELTAEAKLTALRTVAERLIPMTPRWYALNLRGTTAPDEIRALLEETDKTLSDTVTFFYPTHSTVKLVGKKRVTEETPYLRQILFIKTLPENVSRLMTIAGQLAWCYKAYKAPDAPYAIIPNSSMANFQQFIGVFDNESKLEYIENADLTKGTRVRITGGRFVGCEGIILRQKSDTAPDHRTFILQITNTLTLKWEAQIPSHHLQRL